MKHWRVTLTCHTRLRTQINVNAENATQAEELAFKEAPPLEDWDLLADERYESEAAIIRLVENAKE